MRRLLESLNTPMGVLGVVVLIVAVNAFIFFAHYLPRTSSAPIPSATQYWWERGM
jgi:hypothetical protein